MRKGATGHAQTLGSPLRRELTCATRSPSLRPYVGPRGVERTSCGVGSREGRISPQAASQGPCWPPRGAGEGCWSGLGSE